MGARVVALAFLTASVVYLALSLSFPFGTLAKPGPGFFPVGVGVFVCLTALALLVSAFLPAWAASLTGGVGLPPADARSRVAAATLGLVGFCLLLPWLGYPLVAFLFVALLLRRLGGGAWPAVLATALASAIVSWYVFAQLLAVPLPRGALLG